MKRLIDLRITPRAIGCLALLLPLFALVSVAANRPKLPNPHGSLKEPCANCHRPEGWKPARISSKFDHARYGFPLEGAHAAAGCTSCHASLDFSQATTVCQSCHDDPHLGELGTECARCHDSRSFLSRTRMVRAHHLTQFPLTGSHSTLDCESCHPPTSQGQMRFVGTQTDCQSCHMNEYQSAPNHIAGAFPLDCRECHSTLSWNRARFDHNSTAFPLTGAHRTVACASCHGDGVYKGKPSDCASCHMADYTGASLDHVAAGFSPAQCASCHTTTSWAGATFDHDPWFPIFSGRHQGTWNACSDCHIVASDYRQFTCLSCHPHDNKAETDSQHAGRAGYAYDSAACYSCHPRGHS